MMTGADFSTVLPAPSQSHCANNPRVPLPPSPALPSEAVYHHTSAFNGNGPPVCRCCSQPIMDQFILQVQGHMWHSRCLRCSICQTTLTRTCYAGNNQLYCQEDFYRLFGAQCTACKTSIPPTEVVRFAHDNVYHIDCFRCSGCGCLFNTGDEFYLSNDGNLLCQTDFHSVTGKGQDENSNPDHSASLMEYYLMDTNPGRESMDKLARGVGLDVSQVRSWFRSQRAKDRRKGNNPGNVHTLQSTFPAHRVHAPPGGYPLPIVNKARSPGRLPRSASLPPDTAHISLHYTPSSAHTSVWEELWSNDFVPPNVDLQPDHLKNGEVVCLEAAPPRIPPTIVSALLPHPVSGAQGHHPPPSSSLVQNCSMANHMNGNDHSKARGGAARERGRVRMSWES